MTRCLRSSPERTSSSSQLRPDQPGPGAAGQPGQRRQRGRVAPQRSVPERRGHRRDQPRHEETRTRPPLRARPPRIGRASAAPRRRAHAAHRRRRAPAPPARIPRDRVRRHADARGPEPAVQWVNSSPRSHPARSRPGRRPFAGRRRRSHCVLPGGVASPSGRAARGLVFAGGRTPDARRAAVVGHARAALHRIALPHARPFAFARPSYERAVEERQPALRLYPYWPPSSAL